MDCFDKSLCTAKSPSLQIQKDFQEMKKDLINLFKQKDEIIEMLINTNKKLETSNSMLNSNLMVYEEENNRMKFCNHCHKNFSIKEKDDNSCIYHPGELKYYSCKGCGADEYFTCCLKCNKCSSGCKKSKHVCES